MMSLSSIARFVAIFHLHTTSNTDVCVASRYFITITIYTASESLFSYAQNLPPIGKNYENCHNGLGTLGN
jgi:hypothetical protein